MVASGPMGHVRKLSICAPHMVVKGNLRSNDGIATICALSAQINNPYFDTWKWFRKKTMDSMFGDQNWSHIMISWSINSRNDKFKWSSTRQVVNRGRFVNTWTSGNGFSFNVHLSFVHVSGCWYILIISQKRRNN